MKGLELPGWARGAAAFHGVALWLGAVAPLALAGASPAFAIELSPPQAALYTTVSIYPPSAGSMTVCYGFVCRRREILNFTPADKAALTNILAAGRASAAAERAAVQKAGLSSLNEGQSIEYEEIANRGKTSAENLKV